MAGTPCAGPQRLCASVDTNTSAHAVTLALLGDPAIQPKPARPRANEPSPPPPPSNAPIRIALLLPLRSNTLGTQAWRFPQGAQTTTQQYGVPGFGGGERSF